MEAEILHLPLTWSSYCFQSYLDCQLKQEKIFFKKKQNKSLFWCKYIYNGTCLLNFYYILLQVFDIS